MNPLIAVTHNVGYPLPKMDVVFDAFGGATYFAILDLNSEYWQVEVNPADREKTVFVLPSGLYEFNTMFLAS